MGGVPKSQDRALSIDGFVVELFYAPALPVSLVICGKSDFFFVPAQNVTSFRLKIFKSLPGENEQLRSMREVPASW